MITFVCMTMKEKSPYNLLQEIYEGDGWKNLVCCMFLNQTSRVQVDAIRDEFFRRWPNASKASKADQNEMAELIKSLGFRNRRSASIIRMSQEFKAGKWKRPIELHGIGQYGQDSYDIFINGKLDIKNPSDKVLKKYLDWINQNKNGKSRKRKI